MTMTYYLNLNNWSLIMHRKNGSFSKYTGDLEKLSSKQYGGNADACPGNGK